MAKVFIYDTQEAQAFREMFDSSEYEEDSQEVCEAEAAALYEEYQNNPFSSLFD